MVKKPTIPGEQQICTAPIEGRDEPTNNDDKTSELILRPHLIPLKPILSVPPRRGTHNSEQSYAALSATKSVHSLTRSATAQRSGGYESYPSSASLRTLRAPPRFVDSGCNLRLSIGSEISSAPVHPATPMTRTLRIALADFARAPGLYQRGCGHRLHAGVANCLARKWHPCPVSHAQTPSVHRRLHRLLAPLGDRCVLCHALARSRGDDAVHKCHMGGGVAGGGGKKNNGVVVHHKCVRKFNARFIGCVECRHLVDDLSRVMVALSSPGVQQVPAYSSQSLRELLLAASEWPKEDAEVHIFHRLFHYRTGSGIAK